MSEEQDDAYGRFLIWRRVRGEPCPRCQGAGRRSYGSTATWRGGIGGQMITDDVCNVCWGSGSAERTGVDLRKQREGEQRMRMLLQQAVDALLNPEGHLDCDEAGHSEKCRACLISRMNEAIK